MMMMMDGSSLNIPVPNIITASPSGGRFDFDDGGVYCGGWQDGKAHGHGVCTGPKNVGEYSGSWNFGFEMSGVYKWKNGAVYEGRWQNGKRHGVGVEYNGKWVYKGEWSQGFKGRYGVKASSNSAVKYEGTWANGLQDGYGSETYSDGGYYQGQMCRGLRHGYGVRKSAPYGDSQLNNPAKNGAHLHANHPHHNQQQQQQHQLGITGSMMIHSNSLQSQNSADMVSDDDSSPKLDDGFKPNIDRTLASKNGFVLVAKPLDVSLPKQYSNNMSGQSSQIGDINYSSSYYNSNSNRSTSRRNSLSNRLASAAARIPGNNNNNNNHSSSSNSTASTIFRGLRKLRKQKSTSDLADNHLSASQNHHHKSSSNKDHHSSSSPTVADQLLAQVPLTLSPEELDINDPTTVETYTGEWKQDKRNGHGICERSDGLKYEGQWHNDMKCGYGVTTFKDGSKEEGKYKSNILIVDSKVKRFLHFGSSNMRQRLDDAIKMAHQAQTMALKKAEIADTRAATARDKADQATTAALEADRDSQIAFSVARQYSDSQQQLGMSFQPQLALAIQDYPTMFSMQQQQPTSFTSPPHNALQMRRSSQPQQQQQQQQQQFNRFNYETSQQQQSNMVQDHQLTSMEQQMGQQQQQHMQGGKQFLGTLEPFNGRRGSFRGGAHVNQFAAPLGSGGGGRSSPFGASPSSHAAGGSASQQSSAQSNNPNRQQVSSDPFSDLFDHYKSGPADGMHPIRSRNRMLSKQASLDVANSRAGHQQGHFQRASQASGRSLHRMSSMDHAEENQQQQHKYNQQAGDQRANPMEQQLKHLVTSGEEIQAERGTRQDEGSAATDSAADRLVTTVAGVQTPSGGSSYILPTTSAGSQNSSAFYGNQTTPSPSPDLQSSNSTAAAPASTNSGARPPTGQSYYNNTQQSQPQRQQQQQQQQQHLNIGGYPSSKNYNNKTGRSQFVMQPQQQYYQSYSNNGNNNSNNRHQRDVHSLADDQLYMAGSRRMYGTTEFGGDRSDFTDYDFVISSAPRMARRVMRRTASLSRNTPIRSISELKYSTQQLNNNNNNNNSSLANLRQRSVSPASPFGRDHQLLSSPSAAGASVDKHQHQHQPASISAITITGPAEQAPNRMGQLDVTASPTMSSLSASSGEWAAAHSRKPSLQVRYDPNDFGGLMSREEVAVLSHAQREQKRTELELAESRAKRPLLHLYLTIKEFLIHRKLLLSVLMINICLFEMFANLIV